MTLLSAHRSAPAPAAAPAPPEPVGRDSGIDLVRALCVLGVVVLHALMVGVTVSGGGPVFANASEGSWWIAPLSWLLQVMPLFFVIGGFAGLTAYRRARSRGGSALAFVAGRVHRLLLPAVITIACVGIALGILAALGTASELVATAGYRFGQPLWFLAVFLLCQALLPALVALHERAPLRSLAALVTAAVIVDALRGATGIDGIGFVNLAFVWFALQQLGFFLADGSINRLPRAARVLGGALAVTALASLMLTGVFSPDLIAHINPPTTALLLVGLAHTMLVSLARERLSRWSSRPMLSAFHRFVTARAMTIYLWHMPILLAMAGASAVVALATGMALPEPGSTQWWLGRPFWLVAAVGLTALAADGLAGWEARRAPAPTTKAVRIIAAVVSGLVAVVLLLVAGTTTLTAACAVVLALLALRLARAPRRPQAALRAV